MSDESSDKPGIGPKKLWSALRRTVERAGDVASDVARTGVQVGGQWTQNATETAQETAGRIQRKLGEDYYSILGKNPMVLSTLSRSSLLVDNRELLLTAFNIPWATAALWTAASGSALEGQHSIAKELGHLFHYGPGHISRWDEINRFMDTAHGGGHRLKFGHSIDYLPQIVQEYGIEGVPAYFMHLLQDSTTVAGLPIVPHAWDITRTLQAAHVPCKMATGLVSISFSSTLGALAVIALVANLWKLGEALRKRLRTKNYLKTATLALENRDHNAAISNYQRALEIERSPYVLMALGQVYMQRASSRLRAHQVFTEAVTLLADRPGMVVPYHHAKLSVRGLAALQALATADVLAAIHPEHWNDHVRDLVNATVFSFTSAASEQAEQAGDYVSGLVAARPQFSAAINYYLAAKSACYYPFTEERQEQVIRNAQASLRCLGLMAQYDEQKLRKPAGTVRQLWAMEVLPPEEAETALAIY